MNRNYQTITYDDEFEKVNIIDFNNIILKNSIDEAFIKNMMMKFSIPQTLKILISRDAKEILFKREFKPLLLKEFVKVISKIYFNIIEKFFGVYMARETEITIKNICSLFDFELYDLEIVENERTKDKYLISLNTSPYEKIAVKYT